MTDPLANIEERKGQYDLGVMAIRVYQGAMSEAENWIEAYIATSAYFHAVFTEKPKTDDEDE